MAGTFAMTTEGRRGLVLDPRTKLLLLLTVTTLMFSTGNSGWMNLVKPVLSLIPFVLIISAREYKTALRYAVLYAVCFVVERVALNMLTGMTAFILLAMCSIMTRFAPGIMVAAYMVSTTTVSEFMAAMNRMHVTEKITIPLSVIFRFIPTIAEEYHAISDAMRMRGIRFGGRNPGRMIEYRIIPLMVSVVKIGDELSAASLARGLGAPVRRTNVCKIGFKIQDIVVMLVCIAAFVLFFISRFMGQ